MERAYYCSKHGVLCKINECEHRQIIHEMLFIDPVVNETIDESLNTICFSKQPDFAANVVDGYSLEYNHESRETELVPIYAERSVRNPYVDYKIDCENFVGFNVEGTPW